MNVVTGYWLRMGPQIVSESPWSHLACVHDFAHVKNLPKRSVWLNNNNHLLHWAENMRQDSSVHIFNWISLFRKANWRSYTHSWKGGNRSQREEALQLFIWHQATWTLSKNSWLLRVSQVWSENDMFFSVCHTKNDERERYDTHCSVISQVFQCLFWVDGWCKRFFEAETLQKPMIST